MALVEAPVLGDRKPQLVHLVKDEVKRPDRAGEDAGEAYVEVEALVAQLDPGAARFLDEIAESRRVEHVDLVLVPLAEGELRRDCDFAFDFFFVVIGRGIPVVYT